MNKIGFIIFVFIYITTACSNSKHDVPPDITVIEEIPQDKSENLDHLSWYQGTYIGTYIDEENEALEVILTLGDISVGDNVYVLSVLFPDSDNKEPLNKRGTYRWVGVTGNIIQLTQLAGFPHVFRVTQNELIAIEDLDNPSENSDRKLVLKKR